MPTLAAIAYRTSKGYPVMYPRNDLDYASRFLHMMFAWPTQKYEVDPVLARALDKILILCVPPKHACTNAALSGGCAVPVVMTVVDTLTLPKHD